MKIAIIGATGLAGSQIMQEAARRGHSVTAIVRNAAKLNNSKVAVIEKDIFNLNGADLTGFDAVVDAFKAAQGQEEQHQTSLAHLADILSGQEKTRLLVVGGAGSLYLDEQLKNRVMDSPEFPEAYKPTAVNMGKAFDSLKIRKDLNWTYISPSAFFDPAGQRSGAYTIGSERLLVNAAGQSTISYADYAVAMVDEIENARHIKQRFTVVSK